MKKFGLIKNRRLSSKEITEYLGVRRENISARLIKKNLPRHRIGKFWKFKIAEIDAWYISDQRQNAEGNNGCP